MLVSALFRTFYICFGLFDITWWMQYTKIEKYKMYLHSLRNRAEKFVKVSLFYTFPLKLVQINFIFSDNVRILYISMMTRQKYVWLRYRWKHMHSIRPASIANSLCISALTWFIRYMYIYIWNIQSLDNVNINALFPQATVILFDCPNHLYAFWFSCSHEKTFKLCCFPVFKLWAYLVKFIGETHCEHWIRYLCFYCTIK
jgi:hypothetical protein